jgi:hypothetical protein
VQPGGHAGRHEGPRPRYLATAQVATNTIFTQHKSDFQQDGPRSLSSAGQPPHTSAWRVRQDFLDFFPQSTVLSYSTSQPHLRKLRDGQVQTVLPGLLITLHCKSDLSACESDFQGSRAAARPLPVREGGHEPTEDADQQ